RQRLSARQHKDFAARFGELEINVASGAYQEPGIPEVMILSNIVKDGKPIGLADEGQDWHTDMSYSKTIAFANVLYALEVPRRNGKVLGATEFSSMQAAAAHRSAKEGEAAGLAPDLPQASDHRPQGSVRQPGLLDAHQPAAAKGKRRDARIPVRASAQARVPLPPRMDRRRSADVGGPRHHPQRHRRLWPERLPPGAALSGDGHAL